MTKLRSTLWAGIGTFLLGLGAVPIARVPIIGDDFHALFESYAVADGSVLNALVFGWKQGLRAGHFNPVGQAVGFVFHFQAYAVSAFLGISPQYYDVFFRSALMWLTVASAAMVLTWGLRHAGAVGQISLWRNFALLAAVTAATLQLHPWSNDPLTSYAPAGWGSAALGFALLGLALRATVPGRSGRTDFVLVGGLAVFAVLYYEMLVGMIAGTAAVYVGAILRARVRRDRAGLRRALLLTGVGVALPAVIFIAGRFLAIPASQSNYTGTTLSLGPEAIATWWAGMVGALPTGGWPYLFRNAEGVELAFKPVALAILLCIGVGLLVLVWERSPRIAVPWTRSSLIPLAGIGVTWALTTATITTTQKYIGEIKEPGQVYLYYVVGVVCAAILISWVILVLASRVPSPIRLVSLVLVGAFLMVQVALNWRLATLSALSFAPNRIFAEVAVTDAAPEDSRCAALAAWVGHPWPDYYREAVVKGSQEDFKRVFGEPFCSDAQISLPPSVAVTSGSSGLESPGRKDEHWWLTSDQAEITVSNNSKHSPTMEVTATVVPPPCPGRAEVVVDSPGSPRIRLVVGPAGKLLTLQLDVQPGHSKAIHVSVLTPVCHISTDPRSFYAGLYALKAQTPQAVEIREVKGLSGNQTEAPAASLNWLIAPEAEMAVTHNSGASTKLKLTGFAIPPPCPGSTARVTVELPGSPAVQLDTGTRATAIAVAFVVPIGTTRTVRFIVNSPSCRIPSDTRTFFAGLTKLEVSAG